MEEKESMVSGSPVVGNWETESPPVSGGGGVVLPQVMMNMSMERSLGITTTGGGGVAAGGGGGGGGLLVKKKRGRPRKYDSDGNLRLPSIPPPPPPPGFSFSPPFSSSSEFSSSKRGRGRPPGSGNWQLLASLGELFANTAGVDFTPHVVTVYAGEDVAAKILSFSQKGPRGICVLSANGTVSNVSIRQPGSSGGILTYEGRFEILSLTGSYTVFENGGVRSRTGGLSVSLAGPDGRVIGGGVAGLLMAASPIQIVVGSFMPNGYKAYKRKHSYEQRMTPLTPGAPPDTVTAATPISQAAPAGAIFPIPTTQLPVQSHGEADNSPNDKQNLNATSTDSTGWNDSEYMSAQRPSPDINVSLWQ
ncbi:AT-hook motif nuclear-localized protein 10-like [Camellia sinensis]|uniref:AT-hook motif nuclear-localized protein 10-like n=1 Tax=Camellia sinensis TaxID=4442 RepID=UPI0010368EC1|nr:AT-hook motif nuclear-localized protein 10-like [Camellia sinensis]